MADDFWWFMFTYVAPIGGLISIAWFGWWLRGRLLKHDIRSRNTRP